MRLRASRRNVPVDLVGKREHPHRVLLLDHEVGQRRGQVDRLQLRGLARGLGIGLLGAGDL